MKKIIGMYIISSFVVMLLLGIFCNGSVLSVSAQASSTLPLSVDTITVDKESPQNTGTSIQLTMQTSGGVGDKQYLFYYCLNGTWANINTYSSSRTATWTPTAAGTYTIYAESTDSNGTKAWKIMTYTIKPITMDTFTISNNGTSVQLTAQASGGVGDKQYLFYYCLNGKWANINTYSSSNTATWAPTVTGTYTVYAESMDANGTKAWKSITYTVKPITMDAFTMSDNGVDVQLAAQASDGIGNKQYLFYYCLNGKWANINTYSSSNTATWAPTATGTYTVYAESMDANGTKAWKSMTYTVKPITMDAFTMSDNGVDVQLAAQASDGIGNKQYLFYYCLNGKWANINTYSSSNTATWVPTATGTYTVYAESMDANGTKAWKSMTYTVKPITMDTFTMTSNGTSVQLAAQASNGIGNKQYLFYYCLNGKWANINTYSSSNTATWAPTATGTYTVYAESMDANGTKAWKSMTYTVKPITMDAFTMTSNGTSVQLAAQASGGIGDKQYLFYYCLNDGVNGQWANINTYSSSNTATWTPTVDGNYTIYAESMDANGTKSWKSLIFNNISITLSNTSGTVPQGKTFYITGQIAGGEQLYWKTDDSSVATVSNGYILAVSPGTAHITAYNAANTHMRSCTVTVTQAEPIRFAYTSPNITTKGGTATLVAITDLSRTAVKFDVNINGTIQSVTAQKEQEGNTYKWSGTLLMPNAGTFVVTAYSKTPATDWSTCSAGSTSVFVTNSVDTTTTAIEKRRMSDKGIQFVATCEGASSTPYLDLAGTPTIGYGYTFGPGTEIYNNLTSTEQWALLVQTINNGSYTSVVNNFLVNNNIKFNQQQFDSLASFSYNVGTAWTYDPSLADLKNILLSSGTSGGTITATVTGIDSGSFLHVRAQPNASSTVVDLLNNGVSVTFVDYPTKYPDTQNTINYPNGWYKVKLGNGDIGYCYSDYIVIGSNGGQRDLNLVNQSSLITEMSSWCHSSTGVVKGLLTRRFDELEIFLYSEYNRGYYYSDHLGHGFPVPATE